MNALVAAQRERIQRLHGRLQQSPASKPALATFDRDRRMGGHLLAAALAFRLFAVLLPLALLVAVTLGYAATLDRSAPGDAGEAVGISEATLQSLAESSKLESETRWLVAASAVIMLLYTAVKAARAVHAAHSLAWTGGVERVVHPFRAGLVLIAAVAAIALVWGAVGRSRAELGAGGLIVGVLAVIPYSAVWLAVSLALPHADARWTALLPGAAVVGAGLELIHLGTVLFISGQVERASDTYGPLGVAFTILVWLFLISRVVVGSAMLNSVLWQRAGHPQPGT